MTWNQAGTDAGTTHKALRLDASSSTSVRWSAGCAGLASQKEAQRLKGASGERTVQLAAVEHAECLFGGDAEEPFEPPFERAPEGMRRGDYVTYSKRLVACLRTLKRERIIPANEASWGRASSQLLADNLRGAIPDLLA